MYGHMRTYEKCFPCFKKNLIDVYSPDIFIHTWDEIESSTKSWHNGHLSRRKISKQELDQMKRLYNPIEMRVEEQNPDLSADTIGENGISFQGQKFMLCSLKKSNDMRVRHEKRLGKKYDVVLKIRPDIDLWKKLDVHKVPSGTMVISARKFGSDPKSLKSYNVCDIINFGDSETMTRASAAVNQFDKFYLRNKNLIHSPWVDYILSLGININFSSQIYGKTGREDWGILRGGGYA